MLTVTLSPNPIWTHDCAPNPNRPISNICHITDRDIDSIDNFNSNLGPEIEGLPNFQLQFHYTNMH